MVIAATAPGSEPTVGARPDTTTSTTTSRTDARGRRSGDIERHASAQRSWLVGAGDSSTVELDPAGAQVPLDGLQGGPGCKQSVEDPQGVDGVIGVIGHDVIVRLNLLSASRIAEVGRRYQRGRSPGASASGLVRSVFEQPAASPEVVRRRRPRTSAVEVDLPLLGQVRACPLVVPAPPAPARRDRPPACAATSAGRGSRRHRGSSRTARAPAGR